MQTNDPMKRLILDIETSPLTLKGFGIRDQNFGLDQIIKPTRMLSVAAKWYDNDETFFMADFDDDPDDHFEMVYRIWELVNQAYVVIHFNGKHFDMKHLNREFKEQQIQPPKPYQEIDLYKVAKRMFYLPSYKLDYILKWLGHEGKVQHAGFVMWNKVEEGDQEARAKFEEYNIGDILKTELVYKDLIPWIPNHPNFQLYSPRGEDPMCPTCGSLEVHEDGLAPSGTLTLTQCYRCRGCGRSFKGKQAIKRAEER